MTGDTFLKLLGRKRLQSPLIERLFSIQSRLTYDIANSAVYVYPLRFDRKTTTTPEKRGPEPETSEVTQQHPRP